MSAAANAGCLQQVTLKSFPLTWIPAYYTILLRDLTCRKGYADDMNHGYSLPHLTELSFQAYEMDLALVAAEGGWEVQCQGVDSSELGNSAFQAVCSKHLSVLYVKFIQVVRLEDSFTTGWCAV
jgi:hypothetical protein